MGKASDEGTPWCLCDSLLYTCDSPSFFYGCYCYVSLRYCRPSFCPRVCSATKSADISPLSGLESRDLRAPSSSGCTRCVSLRLVGVLLRRGQGAGQQGWFPTRKPQLGRWATGARHNRRCMQADYPVAESNCSRSFHVTRRREWRFGLADHQDIRHPFLLHSLGPRRAIHDTAESQITVAIFDDRSIHGGTPPLATTIFKQVQVAH